jgi:hypothetical protein
VKNQTTWGKGERAPRAKLTAFQVRLIIEQLERRVTHAALALEYGVSRVAITDINRGASWAHVTGKSRHR